MQVKKLLSSNICWSKKEWKFQQIRGQRIPSSTDKLLQTEKVSSLAKYIKKYFGRLQKMVSKSLLVPTDHKAIHRCQPVHPWRRVPGGWCIPSDYALHCCWRCRIPAVWAAHVCSIEKADNACKPSELPSQSQHLLSHSSHPGWNCCSHTGDRWETLIIF